MAGLCEIGMLTGLESSESELASLSLSQSEAPASRRRHRRHDARPACGPGNLAASIHVADVASSPAEACQMPGGTPSHKLEGQINLKLLATLEQRLEKGCVHELLRSA